MNVRNEEKEFQLKLLTYFPQLTLEDIQASQFIEKLVFEFAKLVCPDAVKKMDKFYIDGKSCFEIYKNYLIVCYQGLYGKKNFARLAKIFNDYNPGFSAFYTDRHHCSFMHLFSRGYYVLCLKADIFLHECFLQKNCSIIPASDDISDLYVESRWTSEHGFHSGINRKIKPINHECLHPLEIEFLEDKFPLAKSSLQLDKAIRNWCKKRRGDMLLTTWLNLSFYFGREFNFQDCSLTAYICLLILQLDEAEITHTVKQSRYREDYRKIDELHIYLSFNHLSGEKCCANDVISLNDTVVLKYLKMFDVSAEIAKKFTDILGENNFHLESFHQPIDQVYYIYVTVQKSVLEDFIKKAQEEKEPVSGIGKGRR